MLPITKPDSLTFPPGPVWNLTCDIRLEEHESRLIQVAKTSFNPPISTGYIPGGLQYQVVFSELEQAFLSREPFLLMEIPKLITGDIHVWVRGLVDVNSQMLPGPYVGCTCIKIH
eukprot:m.99070 g.99070  ORF g.99070 m.99070 type:complete len:115 (+) comp13661_c1_seq3:1190-1534(+)